MYKLDFPSRLRNALELKNMKPIDLANKTGINKAIISQYLNGKYNAKQDNIFKIAKVLEVNPAWLMGYDLDIGDIIIYTKNNIKNNNKLQMELLNKCINLNDENKRKILEIVNLYLKEQDNK